MAALYSLPGGLVELGETLAEAALRELEEEVGVRGEILGFLDHVEVIERDPDLRVRQHYVICAHAARWIAGEPRTSIEATDVRWVTPDEVEGLATTPGLAAVLQNALSLDQSLA